ncbi:hypothetical protein GCM10017691_58520 [Pseudonocardia petroleophila]|uniref:histidine kinase n=1 Tax=Pseudonocardia petroleophila TaxID=37331 RepID=A0A7G7MMW3_9PSEU|nr:ATP-binding protein [Pseudonocardia petroleophila]QNG54124.1 hypothetical protein H6H00_09595 [Pseudonocardia petroleophila]
MDGDLLLLASDVTGQLTAWPLVALLAVAVARRRCPALPALAVAALLVELALHRVGLDSGGAVWFAALPLLLAVYPDGRFVPRWFVVPVVVSLGIGVAVLATGGAVTDAPGFAPWVGIAQGLLIGGQVHRYRRRASTAERESVRWAILGLLVCVLCFALLAAVGGPIGEGSATAVALADLAVLPAPVGAAIGLLRPRVVDADAALRIVLAVAVAAPVLALVYGGTLAVAGGWWGAAAVAAAAVPVIRCAGRASAWVVYRGRRDGGAAVTDLGRRLDAQPQARLVPETVLRTVVDSLHLDGAALRGAGALDAAVGETPGTAEEFPVVYQGEQLAVLAVAPRRGETGLTGHDRRVLRLLAVHAAPALHGARALDELTATHSRMLLAREEERRRLRRDLHDDLSPTLAGLRLGAAAVARRAAGSDPELARLAADLQDDIAGAVAQTREIAYGLRPPVLDDLGLVAAIAGRVHGPDELCVRIDAPGGPLELPAAVDLAALRIVQEAVSNVRRHAGATRCTVALALDDDTLTVRVTDDGVGLPARLRPGIGLTSIRERATELGGTVEFGAAEDGGARVDVRLPAGGAG